MLENNPILIIEELLLDWSRLRRRQSSYEMMAKVPASIWLFQKLNPSIIFFIESSIVHSVLSQHQPTLYRTASLIEFQMM